MIFRRPLFHPLQSPAFLSEMVAVQLNIVYVDVES